MAAIHRWKSLHSLESHWTAAIHHWKSPHSLESHWMTLNDDFAAVTDTVAELALLTIHFSTLTTSQIQKESYYSAGTVVAYLADPLFDGAITYNAPDDGSLLVSD